MNSTENLVKNISDTALWSATSGAPVGWSMPSGETIDYLKKNHRS